MKFRTSLLLALAAILTLAAPRPAQALEVSFDFFYDSLSPYGEWIEVGDYGYCWRPAGVDQDWAPYSDGYWTYTDAGWTWVSYEDYGGIVYHYGRWAKVEDEGWVWVPDYEWGPAWVSWRKNDDYVGWAPLPAEAHWQRERGISVWADTSYDIGPASYSFCRFRDFGAPVLRPVIIRRSENIVIIANTINITNISYNTHAGYIFNGGLDYAYVNRFSRRQVPTLKLVTNNNITVVNNRIVNNNVRVTNFNAVQRGNQLWIIAPTVVRPQAAQVAALLQPKVTKVIPQQRVTRGWGSVPADQRTAIRAKFQQETAGKTPETAPAVAVRAADLKVVPIKANPNAKPVVDTRKLPALAEDKTPTDATPKAPGNVTLPPATLDPAKTAREKIPGKRPGQFATPVPAQAQEVTGNPPPAKIIAATPAPIVKARPNRPGVVKPLNPQAVDNPPAGVPANAAMEKRAAAAEAAKQRAADQQATRARVVEQNQQQEIAARNKAQEATAARQRQQELQQQKLQQSAQEQPVRQPIANPRQAQQQELLRERAAQAAASRQRNLEVAPAAASAAARQQALERAQAQAATRQQATGAVPPQRVPARPGKKPLTPEEAAKLREQQQQAR